ncbi:hypothetical protein D3C78_742050 [compost metagenome]
MPLAAAEVGYGPIAGYRAVDIQPLAAAIDDRAGEVDIADPGHGDGGAIAVVQHAVLQRNRAGRGFGSLCVQRCRVVTLAVCNHALAGDAAAIPGQHAVRRGACSGDADGIEADAGGVAGERTESAFAACRHCGAGGGQCGAGLGLQAVRLLAVGADGRLGQVEVRGFLFVLPAGECSAGLVALGFHSDVVRREADVARLGRADTGVEASRIVALGQNRKVVQHHAAAVVDGRAVGLLAGGPHAGAGGGQQGTRIARCQGVGEGQVAGHGRTVAGSGYCAAGDRHRGAYVRQDAHGVIVAVGGYSHVIDSRGRVYCGDRRRIVTVGGNRAVTHAERRAVFCLDAVAGFLSGMYVGIGQAQLGAVAFYQRAGCPGTNRAGRLIDENAGFAHLASGTTGDVDADRTVAVDADAGAGDAAMRAAAFYRHAVAKEPAYRQ